MQNTELAARIAFLTATVRSQHNDNFIPQYCTEDVLRSRLQKHGCTVEMATELVSFQQYDDRIETTIEKSSNVKETVQTKSYHWLVGADGGRSRDPYAYATPDGDWVSSFSIQVLCGSNAAFPSKDRRPTKIESLGEIDIEGLDPEVLVSVELIHHEDQLMLIAVSALVQFAERRW